MSRRSASPAEDAIHDLLQTMSQKERDARYDAKHKQLCVSVSRALENAAWTLDEFCNNDADRQTCLLYTSPSPRDKRQSRMPSSA